MFEGFHRARRRPAAHRAAAWILGALIVHAALVIAAWISSLWEVEKLELPRVKIRLAGAIGLPPPPEVTPAAPAPEPVEPAVPKKRRATERVQPVPPPPPVEVPPPPAEERPPVEDETAATTDEVAFTGDGGAGLDGLPAEIDARDESLASPPTPLGRYDQLSIDAPDDDSHGRSGSIVLILDVDARGAVQRVELSAGMDDALDMQAMQLALKFRFRPARNHAGTPVPGRVRWTFNVHPHAKTS